MKKKITVTLTVTSDYDEEYLQDYSVSNLEEARESDYDNIDRPLNHMEDLGWEIIDSKVEDLDGEQDKGKLEAPKCDYDEAKNDIVEKSYQWIREHTQSVSYLSSMVSSITIPMFGDTFAELYKEEMNK